MLDPTWECRDGRRIPLSKMTKRHIENCIARVVKHGWRLEWLEDLETELEVRRLRAAGKV